MNLMLHHHLPMSTDHRNQKKCLDWMIVKKASVSLKKKYSL